MGGRTPGKNRIYFDAVRSHLDTLAEHGTDRYGREHTPFWMSYLDVDTLSFPEPMRPDGTSAAVLHSPGSGGSGGVKIDAAMPDGCTVLPGKRAYRNIDAPAGSSLYWDQPQVAAAYALEELGGAESAFCARAGGDYLAAFLDRCTARSTGIFLWGNHYYWDAFRDGVVGFKGDEEPWPVDPEKERGDLHEMRPIPPAWDLFARIDREKTERCIRALGVFHVFDSETGGFNRHADSSRSCAFLEAGGILCESLCRLQAYTPSVPNALHAPEMLIPSAGIPAETALRIAEFSFRHRHEGTGLLENNPTVTRWDKHTVTTEVGVWAGSLLRAADSLRNAGQARIGTAFAERLSRIAGRLVDMADQAVSAYLRQGWDGENRRYYGALDVSTATPWNGPKKTLFQPGRYADFWNPLFPSHDYPSALAETCVRLYRVTGKEEYAVAVKRWIQALEWELPAGQGKGAYAEQYGRCLHFLEEAGALLREESPGEARTAGGENLEERAHLLAAAVAREAYDHLFTGRMFVGHPGTRVYQAVDGVGYLLLALLRLYSGEEPNLYGFGF